MRDSHYYKKARAYRKRNQKRNGLPGKGGSTAARRSKIMKRKLKEGWDEAV